MFTPIELNKIIKLFLNGDINEKFQALKAKHFIV